MTGRLLLLLLLFLPGITGVSTRSFLWGMQKKKKKGRTKVFITRA